MDELELSKLLDCILSGSLQKSSVEAILIASSGTLLSDARQVRAACTQDPKLKVLLEDWTLLCNRILKAYDHLLEYFEASERDVLEEVFETVSVSLYRQKSLLQHLPNSLQAPLRRNDRAFWDQESEQHHQAWMEQLRSLRSRKSLGPLKRLVSRMSKCLQESDSAIIEELDEDEAEAYLEASAELVHKLWTFYRLEKGELGEALLEDIAELMEERLTFHEELLG